MKIKFSKIVLIFLLLTIFGGIFNNINLFAQEIDFLSTEGGFTDTDMEALGVPGPTQIGNYMAPAVRTPAESMACPRNNFATEAEYRACVARRNEAVAAEEASARAVESRTWTERIVAGITGAFTGGLGKTVMMLQGIILQGIVIPLLSVLLRVAAAMLSLATKFTLSTDIFRQTSPGVTEIWAIIRDLCNLTFIFVLLYTAIRTIVGSANANTKQMIANVVIAALIINFSMFITRLLIDAGNLLAISLFNQITGNGQTPIDQAIMQSLGLTGLFAGFTTATGGNIANVFSVAFGVISYMQVATILIAFLVFLYAALLMAARSVILIFLIILSPLGFMGNLIPKLAEYSKMWRENLYGQIMIAPVFLLFIFLITKIGGSFSDESTTSATSAAGQTLVSSGTTVGTIQLGGTSVPIVDGNGDYLVYFRYIMIIMLLIVAVKITKKMCGELGKMAEKVGVAVAGVATGLAVGAATGGAALALRQTAGRFATDKLAKEGDDLRARADKGDKGAKIKLMALEKSAKSTYDVRNTKTAGLAGKAYSGIGSQIGIKAPPLGKFGKGGGVYSTKDGKKTGFAGAQEAEQEKANKAYNDAQKSVSGADRVAARGALAKRDKQVETDLKNNSTHSKAQKEIEDRRKEGVVANQEMTDAEIDLHKAETRAKANPNDQAVQDAYTKAQKDRDDKEKELIKKNEEKYKDEIAEQQKIIKEETRKAEIEAEKSLTADEKKKIDRVERARNLAQSMREGKIGVAGIVGLIRSKKRSGKIANKMENQKEKTADELLREELVEMRKAMKEQAEKNKTT